MSETRERPCYAAGIVAAYRIVEDHNVSLSEGLKFDGSTGWTNELTLRQ